MSKLIPLFLLVSSIAIHAEQSKTTPLRDFLKIHELPWPEVGTATKNSCIFTTPSYNFQLSIENGKGVFYQNGKRLNNSKDIIAFLKLCADTKAQSEDTDHFDFNTIFEKS